MFAWLRLTLIGFVVLSVIYVILSIWSRRLRRRKLHTEWDEQDMRGDRDAFVEEGLQDYDSSLRRKLILAVYIVPVTLVLVIIYMTNFM